MAVDEELNARFRTAMSRFTDLGERRMMGGTCFMLGEHMVGGARRDAENRTFMFRVGKENMEAALARPGARQVVFGERRLGGFVHVDAASCSDADLSEWLDMCTEFVTTLPPKQKKRKATR